jgi:hypothetical protein
MFLLYYFFVAAWVSFSLHCFCCCSIFLFFVRTMFGINITFVVTMKVLLGCISENIVDKTSVQAIEKQ